MRKFMDIINNRLVESSSLSEGPFDFMRKMIGNKQADPAKAVPAKQVADRVVDATDNRIGGEDESKYWKKVAHTPPAATGTGDPIRKAKVAGHRPTQSELNWLGNFVVNLRSREFINDMGWSMSNDGSTQVSLKDAAGAIPFADSAHIQTLYKMYKQWLDKKARLSSSQFDAHAPKGGYDR
jgi:hypothetical protein